jgi:adenosylhomocysteine nucleosidase
MRIRFALIALSFFACVHLVFAQEMKPGEFPLVILGAFGDEILLLQAKLSNKQTDTIQGIPFVIGTLHRKQVVIALTGIGKVNAAMTTTLAIEHFKPKQLIFTGIAGAINPVLRPGDIVIAQKSVQYDYARLTSQKVTYRGTRNPFTGDENPLYFPADSLLLHYADMAGKKVKFQSAGKHAPVLLKGTIVTGDLFVASSDKKKILQTDLKADATEMEGAAVAQICWQFRIPCLLIRSISDSADERAAVDMQTFFKTAAFNSAMLVTEIVRHLP